LSPLPLATTAKYFRIPDVPKNAAQDGLKKSNSKAAITNHPEKDREIREPSSGAFKDGTYGDAP